MKPYIGLVHKDEDSAYGITFPDAPGCFSAADDLDDVFTVAQEALALWVEDVRGNGALMPPTRGLSAIKADPEWADAFSTVALVIAVDTLDSGIRSAA